MTFPLSFAFAFHFILSVHAIQLSKNSFLHYHIRPDVCLRLRLFLVPPTHIGWYLRQSVAIAIAISIPFTVIIIIIEMVMVIIATISRNAPFPDLTLAVGTLVCELDSLEDEEVLRAATSIPTRRRKRMID